MKPTVPTGRPLACPACNNRRICSSCGARIRYGKPNPNARWDGLHMAADDLSRLLIAAAEFDSFAQECGDHPTATEFVDWLAPDVIEDAA